MTVTLRQEGKQQKKGHHRLHKENTSQQKDWVSHDARERSVSSVAFAAIRGTRRAMTGGFFQTTCKLYVHLHPSCLTDPTSAIESELNAKLLQ